MEYEKIKQLLDDMGESGLTEINIDFPDGTKINMKKEACKKINSNEKTIPDDKILEKEQPLKEETEVKSPMVGTFYIKPDPNSKPYVEVGSRVKKGDILCIIEAMKLMNEIESEYDGEIVEILVKDGEIVEYGKPLFRIK